jgi:hypothetical protein
MSAMYLTRRHAVAGTLRTLKPSLLSTTGQGMLHHRLHCCQAKHQLLPYCRLTGAS